MAGRYFPEWPRPWLERDVEGDERVNTLWRLQAAYNGTRDLRQQFSQRKSEIEQRAKEGELGPKGVEMELKKLAAEFEPKLGQLAALVNKAKAHHNAMRDKLVARPAAKESASADEAVRRAFQEHRAISRFESLDSTQRRDAIRLAIEKKNANFLSAILNEPALLGETDARRIEVALMAQADKALFRGYEELGGKLDGNGEVLAAHESPLAVASYVLDDTRDWIAEEVGGLDARSVLGRAGVDLDAAAIMLTSDQAKDTALYRAAKVTAAADGKILSIVGDDSMQGSITPE